MAREEYRREMKIGGTQRTAYDLAKNFRHRTLQEQGAAEVNLRKPCQAATPTLGRLLLSPESVFT